MKYYPLTTPQQNIWNLQKYYPDTAVTNLCGAIFFKEKRESTRLQQAICLFIRSQSGMRLRFQDGEQPVQYVSEDMCEDIPVLEFADREEFDRYAENFAQNPIGLTEHAMYRFVVFQIVGESGILVALSHLIADAWTFGLMAKRIDEAYRRLEAGTDISLEQEDYTEFVQEECTYHSSEKYQRDKAFWEGKYTGYFEKSPIKISTVQVPSIEAERVTRTLSVSLEHKIGEFCKEYSVSQAVLFETALFIYLAKINRENRSVTIGVPVLNRSSAKEKRIAGMFVSTMPLTIEMDGELSALEAAKKITKGHMELFRHQKYPYADILKTLRKKQDTAGDFSGNLYDVMVSYQNARTETGAETKWYSNGYSEVPLTVHIDNRDGNECHVLNVDYQIGLFQAEEVEYLIDRLLFVLEQIAEDSNRNIKDVCIVPEREFMKVTGEFNDTAVDYPKDKCIHELFQEQAERIPEKTALVFQDKKFTYRELDAMSNSLAHFLRGQGIGRGDVVPIIARRSWHIVVAMLGILKAGAAYMPVSPDYPADRIASMLEISRSRIAMVCGYNGKINIKCVDMERFDYRSSILSVENANKPEDLCYVIFTSGSTGTPKGVSVRHRNVVNYCSCNNNNVCCRIIKNGYGSIVSVTNMIFDIFVTETLLPLLNGITIYFGDDEETLRQDRLGELVDRSRIDIMQTTPTKMRSFMLDKEKCGYLRNFKAIILGGEAFPADLYCELKKYTDAHIFNIYGPAETTVWSSNAEIAVDNGKEAVGTDITIGKPIANTQIYILDSDNNPLPIGVPGELCIAGDGVGPGYLNRPELTAERFVPNPFATEENGHGKTMYHTGDLARWRADGEIEYLGRIDTQVKIRGLRIELGEIESVMSGFPGIALCAVADKKDETGRQYLVGYYTLADGKEAQGEENGIRQHLSAKLPGYMVPNYFVRLDAMPMTPSGKTDRKNLPVPDFSVQEEEYIAPETDTEIKLAEIWKKLLNLPKVGRLDDFFELGGDSLLAISMLSEIETEFSVEISMKDVLGQSASERFVKDIMKQIKKCPKTQYFQALPQHKYSVIFSRSAYHSLLDG